MLGLAIIFVIVGWAVIHILVRRIASSEADVLPSTTRGRPNTRRFATTDISVKYCHVKVETTAWNHYHDWASSRLASRRFNAQKSVLTSFYDVGVVAGALGMVAALGVVLWTCYTGLSKALEFGRETPQPMLLRRDLGSDTPASQMPVIQAIIPGVTVPLSHLLPIVLALFFCQVLHELGHAVAAAVEFVPIQSCGVALTLFIPSAFVSFPSEHIESLKARSRARIVAAGAWHNALLWSLLYAFGWLRVTYYILTTFGYEDITDVSRVVLSVGRTSTLGEYIPPGSILTHVDDVHLAGEDDKWTAYMTSPRHHSETLGWCVPTKDFHDIPETCCVTDASVSLLSCFITLNNNEHGCVDAVPILSKPKENVRCQVDSACPQDTVCVRPDAVAKLLRLTVQREEDDDVILWRGPKEEVWEEVELGTLRPRISFFLPLWLPNLLYMFEGYIKMVTLSLFLFNLLPLPRLDGAQFLDVLFGIADGMAQSQDYELEDYELAEGGEGMDKRRGRGRYRKRWKSLMRQVVRGITIAAVGICVITGAWNAL